MKENKTIQQLSNLWHKQTAHLEGPKSATALQKFRTPAEKLINYLSFSRIMIFAVLVMSVANVGTAWG